MTTVTGPMVDAVPVLALVVLLVVAFRQLPDWLEGLLGLAAAVACVLSPASTWRAAGEATGRMLPVVVFLIAILVVAAQCSALGLFRAIGHRIGSAGVHPVRFLGLTFVAAVSVTAVLSLDATVVLLTLVVLAAATTAGVSERPGLFACVRLANSSSLLLPVSNLTTLLATHRLGLGFGTFALVMAPAWLAAIGVEYAVTRLVLRRDLTASDDRAETAARETEPLPRLPLVVLAAMLVGFAILPLTGVGQAWAAAIVAVVAALALVPSSGLRPLTKAHPGFGVFVLGLAVVVDALTRGGLADLVRDLLPGSTGLLDLLWLAVLATVVANVVNNLPATLLLVPLVAPLGTVPLLATLIGLNAGASLTWTGSLANLLWRRTLAAADWRPSSADFHRLSLLAVPATVLTGTVLTWAWAHVVL